MEMHLPQPIFVTVAEWQTRSGSLPDGAVPNTRYGVEVRILPVAVFKVGGYLRSEVLSHARRA